MALGATVGAAVAGLESTAEALIDRTVDGVEHWWAVVLPAVGVIISALILRAGSTVTASTSDEFIRAFHGEVELQSRPFIKRVLATIATIGSGTPLGLEGPSAYTGAYAGSASGKAALRRATRTSGTLSREGLIVAGTAAGVAAIFRAPATGVLFALEAPYRSDVARRALIPALVAAATSYSVFAALLGGARLFSDLDLGSIAPTGRQEFVAALSVGLIAGLGARAFAAMYVAAKKVGGGGQSLPRTLIGAGLLSATIGIVELTAERSLVTGPGASEVLEWAVDPGRGLGLLAVVFGARIAVTCLSAGSGGVGGVFVPLAAAGVLAGRMVGGVVGDDHIVLYVVLGLAAFLGAGYRVPLTAVMFVAETTGSTSFVVPALVATAISQTLMGSASVSPYQHDVRRSIIEDGLRERVGTRLHTDLRPIDADVPVQEIEWSARHDLGAPVFSDESYIGLASPSTVLASPVPELTIGEIARHVRPIAADASLERALQSMDIAGVDRLVVLGTAGEYRGTIDRADIVRSADA